MPTSPTMAGFAGGPSRPTISAIGTRSASAIRGARRVEQHGRDPRPTPGTRTTRPISISPAPFDLAAETWLYRSSASPSSGAAAGAHLDERNENPPRQRDPALERCPNILHGEAGGALSLSASLSTSSRPRCAGIRRQPGARGGAPCRGVQPLHRMVMRGPIPQCGRCSARFLGDIVKSPINLQKAHHDHPDAARRAWPVGAFAASPHLPATRS